VHLKIALARTTLLLLVLLVAVPAIAEEQAVLLHSAPARAEANQPLKLEGTLVDDGRRLSELVIRYRGPGEPYAEVPLERQYGDLYRGRIPAEHMVPPGVEYYVEGVLKNGDRVPLFQTGARPTRVLVAGELPRARPVAAAEPARPTGRKKATEPEAEAAPTPKGATKPASSDDEVMAALAADLPESEAAASPAPKGGGRKSSPASASRPPAPVAKPPPPPEPQEPVGSSSSASGFPDDPPGPAAGSGSGARSDLEEDLALYSAEDTLALATRHAETVSRVPAIATSFGREQLRAFGARTVADVLDVVPGLSVSRDVQGFHRVSVRGLRNDAEVLFLLNGHRLNSFFDGRALMDLPVENLDRVEVIRGPGSALYGAGAFLGVVNLVTDRSEGVRVTASGGGFTNRGEDALAPTLDGHVSAGTTAGGLRLFGDVDVWSQGGDSAPIDRDALDADTLNQKLRLANEPAGLTRDERLLFNASVGFSYDFGTAGRLSSSVRFLTEDRTALMGLFDSVGEDSELSWSMGLLDLSYEVPLAGGVLLRARGYADQQNTRRLFQLAPRDFRINEVAFPEGLLEQTRVTTRTAGVSADVDLALGSTHRLALGVVAEMQMMGDYAYETNYTRTNGRLPQLTPFEGLDVSAVTEGPASNRMTLGFFAQEQWTVITPLTLTFGVRVDATQLPRADDDGTISGSRLVPSINPRVGLVFAGTDTLVLKALYGRAFRSPTLQELAERIPDTDYNQGRFEGNPLLTPATVDTVELGVDLIQAAGDSRVRLRGNAFYERFNSPIIPVDNTGNIVPLRNRELGVRVYGIEGEARLEASKRANAWVNASFFRAEDLELPSQSRLLTDTPQARFNVGVSMPIGDWVNFDVVLRAGAERRNNSRSVLELIRRYKIPAYSLITAQVRTEPIAEHFELALVAHNLFDHDMRDDVPRPDRVPGLLPREGQSVYLTLRAHY